MNRPPLVIFRKQLGDVLLLEPALAKLAASTGEPVMLATRPGFGPLLELMEQVIPAPRMLLRSASQVISFDPTPKAGLWALTTLAKEKRLIVTRPRNLHAWHSWVYRTACAAEDETEFYRAEYFFNVMPCQSAMTFRPPHLRQPPRKWLPASLPESYVLLHATSAWQRKSWPHASWAKVLAALHAQGVGPFVVTGGNAQWEAGYAAALQQDSGVPLINLCGRTSLQGYLAAVNRASLVLCIDGSATHLAAAFRRPSVTLFGPTHPLHWHFPSPLATLIDARDFAKEEKPAVASIPAEAVQDVVMCAWNRIQP